MSKSLEELQREYEKNTVKLEQEKRKLRRLENRKSYLDSGSRKQRSHRLITRGAAIESVMPEVKILTEQEFYSLMERIAEWQPDALVVGVPFHPDGAAHENTRRAQRFARQLRGRFGLPVFEVDERYSTTEAHAQGARDADAAAAAIILEQFLRSLP